MTRGARASLLGVTAAAIAIATTAAARPASAGPSAPRSLAGLPASAAHSQTRHVYPLWRVAPRPSGRSAPQSIGQPGGYDPAELRSYLKLHGTGAGRTIAIIEPFNMQPSIVKAMAAYDSYYGLPPACSSTVTTGCFALTVVAPAGTDNNNPRAFNWPTEADLDVELVHALAPQAAILVVEAHDDVDSSMMAAIDYAASHHVDAISNSWGEPEFSGQQALDTHCQATGALCVFASGDAGNPGLYPAASPNVLAVGGTTLDLTTTGRVRSEIAWQGSGGGVSVYEPRPAYQRAADPYTLGRGIPDVSFDGDPNSGIANYYASIVIYAGHRYDFGEGWQEVGGTSAGAPAWGAILTVADQQRAAAGRLPLTTAQIHAALYAKATKPLADITVGSNGTCGPICSAGAGYDLVTGEGSPRPGLDQFLGGL
jgi:subtilase family serine protease